MFGISWPEWLLIGVVAVIAIGPKDLPPLMRKAGQMARHGRVMFEELRRHWEDIPNQLELEDMQKQADILQKESFKPFLGDAEPPMAEAEPMSGEDMLTPAGARPKDKNA
ncbi:MAG TPA: twin-arginine translocase TatA/TatE family subunit [Alphaproteobacteria bacterium]|nr:twin-arginine translocase TatA/TatE family subunit [Alphaproteobacteria bacterium]